MLRPLQELTTYVVGYMCLCDMMWCVCVLYLMVPHTLSRFATFLLSEFTGQPTDVKPPAVDEGTCWGHLGATYGWNSVAFFTPGNNISLSVGTNTETDEQAGPSDAYCIAYNRVRQIIARAEGRQKTPIEDW